MVMASKGGNDDAHVGVVAGVDIGGTGTRFLAMTRDRTIVARSIIETPSSRSAGTASEFLIANIQQLVEPFTLQGIGIGASGPVDPDGTIQNPDTLPAFTGEPLVDRLTKAFRVAVTVDNDAACAAIAEHGVGAGRGVESLLHVTLGTGVGTALIIGGALLRGGDRMHPEGGHISVPGQTPDCYCGRSSCWEQRASRQALQRAAAELLGRPANDPGAMSELGARADAGEATAIDVFCHYGRGVADGLATLLALYRPERVVLGGSAAAYLPYYHRALREALQPLKAWISQPEIVKTELDDYGGAIGGAILAS
jgi:glucokinase